MATFSLLSRDFEVPETSKTFLENYLSRVQNYVSKNHLDISLSDDLSERLVEKLHDAKVADGNLTEKSVVSIVNSLGEPEDIFRDLMENAKSSVNPKITKEDVKDFFKREFHRNQKEGVILGVCAGLGETFGINPIWIRLTFIILTFAYGSSILIYIILGILLPDISRSEKSPVNEPMEKKIWRQANEFAQDLESRTKTYASKDSTGIVGAFAKLIHAIVRVAVGVIRVITLLIAFVVLASVSVALFSAGISAVIASGLISSDLVIHSEQLFAHVPEWFAWSTLASGISLIILSVMIGSRSLRRPVWNTWLGIICLVMLLGGIFGGVRTAVSVIGDYQYTGEQTLAENSLKTASGMTYTISELPLPRTPREFSLGDFSDLGTIELMPSDDNTLTAKVIASLQAHDKSAADAIFSTITGSKIEVGSGAVTISRASADNYSKPTPFSFLRRNIKLSVPKNVTIVLDTRKHRIINLEKESGGEYRRRWSCVGSPIIYDAENKTFLCKDTEPSVPYDYDRD